MVYFLYLDVRKPAFYSCCTPDSLILTDAKIIRTIIVCEVALFTIEDEKGRLSWSTVPKKGHWRFRTRRV
jgi:hypothetical protein